MSLFQCDNCGCCENTNLTGGYHLAHHLEREGTSHDENLRAAEASYKEILGLAPDQMLGSYCSACDPGWWADPNNYGVGPRPADYADRHDMNHHTGKWHDKFQRSYLQKGMFHTDENGNLAHIITLDTNVDAQKLEAEDPVKLPAQFKRMQHRLPAHDDKEVEKYKRRMRRWVESIDTAPNHLQPRDEATRRMVLMHFASTEIKGVIEESTGKTLKTTMRISRSMGRAPMMAMAMGLGAMGAMGLNGLGLDADDSREPEPAGPKKKTQADYDRIAAAAAKREMRATKRVKHQQRGTV